MLHQRQLLQPFVCLLNTISHANQQLTQILDDLYNLDQQNTRFQPLKIPYRETKQDLIAYSWVTMGTANHLGHNLYCKASKLSLAKKRMEWDFNEKFLDTGRKATL